MSKTFVCGVELDGDRIVRIAPYLASLLRRTDTFDRDGLRALVRRNSRGPHPWRAEVVASCGAVPPG